jgi:amino acid adenylation domain-containing protein
MTASFPRDAIGRSLFERFQKVAREFPARDAVRARTGVTSYAELESLALSVAGDLVGRVAGTPGPVALFLGTGTPLFAAMLGALAAGRFYVPLDPGLPDSRLEAILRDLDAAAVVTDAASAERAARLFPASVSVLRAETGVSAGAPPPRLPAVLPDDLAYVLFTSGSTGKPKGVMQSHRNVLHNVWKLAAGLEIVPQDRITLLSSPSFGASVSDIFGALMTGAAVCPHNLSGDGLRLLPEFLEREAITVYHSVPSVFRSFASTLDGREDLSRVRVIKLGGEAVLASDFDLYRNRFAQTCVFHVGLGATEMNVIRQWFARRDTPWPGAAPLGYAVDDTEVVLLDESGAPSHEGEIAVIASTLAVGYWRDPVLTAATFLPVPGRPDVRLFRTGDFGRLLPNGLLLHAGRRDARVKVRGHRVETAEVEAALLDVPGVRDAVVEGREGPAGTRLTAWVAANPGATLRIGTLRRALSRRLPASMVPSAFVVLDALPRTPTGKVDRPALPQPGTARPALEVAYREPDGRREAAAAEAFALVLGLARVGSDDDFFELGGDSLSAVELLANLSERLGAPLSVTDLLEAPTPAGLAARAPEAGGASAAGLVRLREGAGPPVFVVPGGAGDGEDLFAARRIARVTACAAPFFALRSGPAPHPPVEELAARWVRDIRAAAPTGPYVLVGDCMGGILAFAIALRLRRDGERVALLALLDVPFPGPGRRVQAWLRLQAPRVHQLWRRALYFGERSKYHATLLRAAPRGRWAHLRRIAGAGARGLTPPVTALRREALDRRASYLATLLAWRPDRFDGAIRVLECEESRRRGYGEAWGRLCAASLCVRVAGDHEDFILEHGEQIGSTLSRWITEAG